MIITLRYAIWTKTQTAYTVALETVIDSLCAMFSVKANKTNKWRSYNIHKLNPNRKFKVGRHLILWKHKRLIKVVNKMAAVPCQIYSIGNLKISEYRGRTIM